MFEELVAADYINHERGDMLVDAAGPQDWSDVLARLSASFPDVAWTVLRTVAEADHVWIETRMSGTHQGAFFGIAPTGSQRTLTVRVAGRAVRLPAASRARARTV